MCDPKVSEVIGSFWVLYGMAIFAFIKKKITSGKVWRIYQKRRRLKIGIQVKGKFNTTGYLCRAEAR